MGKGPWGDSRVAAPAFPSPTLTHTPRPSRPQPQAWRQPYQGQAGLSPSPCH